MTERRAAYRVGPGHRPLDAEALWRLQRLGAAALAPDASWAVLQVSTPDLAANRSRSALWRVPLARMAGRVAAPRRLTWCGDSDAAPVFSPRGDRVAFLARRPQPEGAGFGPQAWVIDSAGGEAMALTAFGPGVQALRWAGDGASLFCIAWVWPEERGMPAQQRRWAAERGRKASGYATAASFYRHWDRFLPQGQVPTLLRVDLRTRRVTDLLEGTGLCLPLADPGLAHYALHPDGTRVAVVHDAATGDPAQMRPDALHAISELTLAPRGAGAPSVRRLLDTAGWDFEAPSYSPCGTRLAFTAAERGRVHTALQQPGVLELDEAPARRWRLVTDPAWDREAEAPLRWSPDGGALYFTAEDRGRRPLWRCVLATGACAVAVPGGWVQGFDLAPSADAARPHLLVLADSARHPPQLHWHPGPTRPGAAPAAARRVERFNDRVLAEHALGAGEELHVPGACGDPVQVWLTYPANFDARRRHPLLQVIHGGPHAAAGDTWSWRWNAHVLAGAGAVVAQVNYHGSSGFGHAFRHSLMGRQGELELQDIEAATTALLRRRWADPQRVFAAGGSYGGFLVAWMNGHLPAGRYRAYVCHAGVFDRVATASADSYLQRPKDLGATFWDDLPRVLAQSPHAFARHFATPTLVTHGARDHRVPDCNGLAYYNTLQARGVPARLLWFPDEHHWVLQPHNSLQWHREVMGWIAAHGG